MIKDFIRFKARHNILLYKKIREIDELYKFTKEALQDRANAHFLKIFKTAIRESRFYSKLYAEHGVSESSVKSLDDISRLPVISKTDIRDKINEVLTGSKLSVLKGYTSGTSGSPLTVYRGYDSIITENAYHWHYRILKGMQLKDPKIVIRGDFNKDILYHKDRASNSIYLSSYNLNEKHIDKVIQLIEEFQPKAIIGYPSSAYILATECLKKKIKLDIPFCFTSSETLYDFQRERCESTLGTQIYDWYGNSERTVALAQCNIGNYHELPLYSITEYQDDKLITTSLINDRFPLIRYQVDDKVETSVNSNCACGLKAPVIRRVHGRSDDIIILKDGTRIGSPGISTSFKNINSIRYTQLIQQDYDNIQINIVADKNFKEEDKKQLISNLRDRLGEGINYSACCINESELLKNRSGKFQLIVNKIRSDISAQS